MPRPGPASPFALLGAGPQRSLRRARAAAALALPSPSEHGPGAPANRPPPRAARVTVARRGGPGLPPPGPLGPRPLPAGRSPPGRDEAAQRAPAPSRPRGPGREPACGAAPRPSAAPAGPRRPGRSRACEAARPPRAPAYSQRYFGMRRPRSRAGSLLSSSEANSALARVRGSLLSFSFLYNSPLLHPSLLKRVAKTGHHQLQTFSVLTDAIPRVWGKNQLYYLVFKQRTAAVLPYVQKQRSCWRRERQVEILWRVF